MKDIVLAADLGGTNLRMAAVSYNGDIIKRVKLRTPTSGRKEAIVDLISKAAEECLSGVDNSAQALSLALPGTVNGDTGLISKAPNLRDLEGFFIGSAVESKVGMPVILQNDGNAAAVGEHWLGASVNSACSIMVTLGTGVGGGIIVDSKIVNGLDGTAGEIGHINVEPEGIPCGCGSRGCLEQYASATAVEKMAKRARDKNPADFVDYEASIDSEIVFEKALEGELWATEIFKAQGYYLGIALAGLINCLNPEVIVVGGGAAGAWEAFMPSLVNEVRNRAYTAAAERARIVRAELDDNAGILGAARTAFEELNISVVEVV